MSADEFWKDDPQLFVSYRTSFINKKQREMEELDYKCWYQGLYIFNGNGTLFKSLKQFLTNVIASMFKGKKDNQEIENYPERPYRELERLKREEEKQKLKRKKYDDYQQSLAYYGSMKQRYIENIKSKDKKGV